mgnify:CR=1 FL=1
MLINAGGLRAGLSNLQVAETLLKKGKSVVFFYLKEQQWKVMEDKKRLIDLHILPNKESKCFVFFDEARCRGVDVKRDSDAVDMLNHGP